MIYWTRVRKSSLDPWHVVKHVADLTVLRESVGFGGFGCQSSTSGIQLNVVSEVTDKRFFKNLSGLGVGNKGS